MSLYTEIVPDDAKGLCGVTEQMLETAVQVWTWMQQSNDQLSVAATARAFNTTSEIICRCVRTSTWMYLDGPDDDPEKQTIGYDGE